jgi:hypothetical protein
VRPNKALELTGRRLVGLPGSPAGRPPGSGWVRRAAAGWSVVLSLGRPAAQCRSVRPRSAPRSPPLVFESLLASESAPSSGPSSLIPMPLIPGDPWLSVWSSARGISCADAGWGSPVDRSPAFVSLIPALRGSRRVTPRWTFSAEPCPPRPLSWSSKRRRSCSFGRGSGRASRDPAASPGLRTSLGSRATLAGGVLGQRTRPNKALQLTGRQPLGLPGPPAAGRRGARRPIRDGSAAAGRRSVVPSRAAGS